MENPLRQDIKQQILSDMGVDIWLLRDTDEAASISSLEMRASEAVHNKANSNINENSQIQPDDWSLLQQDVASCTGCSLAKSRAQTVFGVGNMQADLLLIGEAPGMEEERQGQPFVGKTGKLLTAMLFSIGLQREQVYICNVLKCRPPNNRNPLPEEVSACAGFLNEQISHIRPKVILALGSIAAQSLLQTDAPVYKMREADNVLPATNTPVVVTYHPASLIRNPEQKAFSWQDLTKVKRLLKNQIVE